MSPYTGTGVMAPTYFASNLPTGMDSAGVVVVWPWWMTGSTTPPPSRSRGPGRLGRALLAMERGERVTHFGLTEVARLADDPPPPRPVARRAGPRFIAGTQSFRRWL